MVGKLHLLGNRMPAFSTSGSFLPVFYCCFIFAAKERSPDILVEPNNCLCDIRESAIFHAHTVHLIVIS